jgi:hypothetical protein
MRLREQIIDVIAALVLVAAVPQLDAKREVRGMSWRLGFRACLSRPRPTAPSALPAPDCKNPRSAAIAREWTAKAADSIFLFRFIRPNSV